MKLRCHAKTLRQKQCKRKAATIGEYGYPLCFYHNHVGQYPAYCVEKDLDTSIVADFLQGHRMDLIAAGRAVAVVYVEKVVREMLKPC